MARQYDSQPDLTIDLDTDYAATLHTNQGDINIRFRPAEAPQAVNNFLFLAREGFYDGVIFHRVVPGFVVQGGDPVHHPPLKRPLRGVGASSTERLSNFRDRDPATFGH